MTDARTQLARTICSSLESLMVSPSGFGVPLSPTQRAIARVIDGRPLGELRGNTDVRSAFGGSEAVAMLPHRKPTEVVVLAGVRSGKSQFAAGTAICASQNIDISDLKAGETPRVVIVSLTLDNAHATFGHVTGTLLASPVLSSLVIGKPTSDSVYLYNPSGRPVEIKVVCLNAAGGSLVSRWLLGAIFDEAPRCPADGVKSLSDARANVVGRLRPGGCIMTIGSPWSPVGPIPDLVRENFGRPTGRMVVVRATGPQMNPAWWTPARVESTRQTDPQSYRTDCQAEFCDPEENLLSAAEVDAVSTIASPRAPNPLQSYTAVIDPATRGNGWTLVVLTRTAAGHEVAAWKQWVGSKVNPLSPSAVFREIADLLRPYRVSEVVSDQWAADPLRELADQAGLSMYERPWSESLKLALFDDLRVAISQGQILLPTDRVIRADLLSVKRRVTQSGVAIDLPKTSDGRHCDYAAALALGMGEFLDSPQPAPTDDPTDLDDAMRRSRQETLADEYGYGDIPGDYDEARP